MEKSWHQKKRESLWSAGHQYSLWAPPLTFRFVAKTNLSRFVTSFAQSSVWPTSVGFPSQFVAKPQPPDPKLTSQSSHKNYHHHYHHHHHFKRHYLRHYTFTKALFIDWIVQRWLAAATNWSHWDIWRGIDWNEGNIYQTINVIIKYYWSCYVNVCKNRRIEEIEEFCIILWILHVLDKSF